MELAAKVMPPYPTTMVGGYQFDRKTFFDKINGTGYSLSRVFVVPCGKAQTADKSVIEEIRNKIVKRIESVLPQDEAGIASALIAGVRNGISQKVTNNYRDSGLAHFLSISGLHMSMLAGFMFLLVRYGVVLVPSLALRYDSKKIAAVFAVVMSFVYLLISGYSVPTQRAFLMTLIFLIGVMISRRSISMRTISWAALCVLMVSPVALITPSFQMSFAAVVALIAFYESCRNYVQIKLTDKNIFKIVLVYLFGIVVSDFIASIATLPYSIYHFNRVAVYTSLGNLLAGPIIGLWIMPFVLISMLLMPFGLDYIPLKILGYGIHWVNEITAYVSALPHAGVPVMSMPMWGLIAITLGGLWLCLWQRKWRHFGWIGIMIGSLSLCLAQTPDVLIDNTGKAIAIKDKADNMVVLPSRGKSFIKNIWLEKTSSPKRTDKEKKELSKIWQGREEDKSWLDLSCDKTSCTYKDKVKIIKGKGLELNNQTFDHESSGGASIYLEGDHITIHTVRDYTGHRYWNE